MVQLSSFFQENIDNVEESTHEFTPLAPGKYRFILKEITEKDNLTKYGDTMINVRLDLIEDEHGQPMKSNHVVFDILTFPHESTEVPDNYPKDKKSWDTYQQMTFNKLRSFIKCFGGDVKMNDLNQLIGQVGLVSVKVEYNDYSDKEVNKVSWYLTPEVNTTPSTPAPAKAVKAVEADEDPWGTGEPQTKKAPAKKSPSVFD